MQAQPQFLLDGKALSFPKIEGTEGEQAVDIQALRFQSSYKLHDPGYANTSSCLSAITFVDGDKGILRHRGYAMEDLAHKASFLELAYALIYGDLPCLSALEDFEAKLFEASCLSPQFYTFALTLPKETPAMGLFLTLLSSLSSFHPDLLASPKDADAIDSIGISLLAKVSSVAALVHSIKSDRPLAPFSTEPSYTKRLFHSLFEGQSPKPEAWSPMAKALDTFLLLHADHEQNCSTATVRMIASSGGGLLGAICGGIAALSGPLHGGASGAVIEMLASILERKDNGEGFIEKSKRGEARLMGFGHRVYKNHDPRALMLKQLVETLLEALSLKDPLLNTAKALEEKALADPYFIERKLYPNLDFYSGTLLRALNIPSYLFTILFAVGRTAGWIAHYKELVLDKHSPLYRPRQIYIGPPSRPFLSLYER